MEFIEVEIFDFNERGKSLANALGVGSDKVDLVDLNRAGLSISSSVVEHVVPLKGEGTRQMERFYSRIGRGLLLEIKR